MTRIVAGALFVLGLIVLVCGILKVLPGMTSSGIALMFAGVLLFGLSFIKPPEVPKDAPPEMSAAQKIPAVFFEPARVFQNLRAHPRWVAAFFLLVISTAVYNFAFTARLGVERTVGAAIDKTIEGGFIPADRAAEIRAQAIEAAQLPTAKVASAINGGVGTFALMALLGGLFTLLVTLFGGRINFWQAFAVAVYAWFPVSLIQNLLSLLLLFIKSPDDIDPLKGQGGLARADLGLLFTPAQHPFLYVLGSFVSVFVAYRIWLMATGLKNGGERVSANAAWSTTITLWILFLLIGLASAALFPSFIA